MSYSMIYMDFYAMIDLYSSQSAAFLKKCIANHIMGSQRGEDLDIWIRRNETTKFYLEPKADPAALMICKELITGRLVRRNLR